MKFKIKTQILKEKLKDSIIFTNKSNKIPSLSNVIIIAEENSVTLIGTDLITEGIIKLTDNVEIFRPGKVLTDTTKLLNILKFSNEDEIVLETEGNSLIYTEENSLYELYTFDTSAFSYFNLSNESFTELLISSNDFYKALRETVFTAKNTAYRAYLTGINLILNNNILKLVSSDNYRLSFTEIPLLKENENKLNKIIPKKTANQILKFLEEFDNSTISLKISEKYFSLTLGDITLNSKLIDDIYPDISPILNRDYSIIIPLDKKSFFNALKRASIFAIDNNTPVTLNFENNQLTFYSEDVSSGRSKTTIKVNFNLDPIKFSLKPAYLFDMEQLITSENFNLKLIDTNLPVLIEDPENLNFKYLIQPTQL